MFPLTAKCIINFLFLCHLPHCVNNDNGGLHYYNYNLAITPTLKSNVACYKLQPGFGCMACAVMKNWK
jgi:hypothetical protein